MKKFKEFFKRFRHSEHKVIARDEELVAVLKVLDEYGVSDYHIVSCGWIGHTEWCLYFKMNDASWRYVVEDLKEEGLENITLFGKDREIV